MKVLFFSAWYPHRYDTMAGLFVRKHAEAVAAQGVDVAVFYLHADSHISQAEWVEQQTNGVREFYYYYSAKNKIEIYTNFWKGFLEGYKRIFATWGKADVVQANVLTKNAWCAYYLWKRFKIPYVVIEHWSGYLPANGGYKGFFHKRITERIAKEAKCLMPVSPMLMEAMKAHGIENKHWELVNNVVDGFFFSPPQSPSQGGRLASKMFTFLHVSCFDEAAKNTCGLLRATAELYKQRQDFSLLMVGTGIDIQLALNTAKTLNMPDSLVRFTGELSPQEVASEMRQADCFVFFSNYETAGVVLSESLAIGLPIITTPVGIASQIIYPETGRLVEIRNEKQLTATMSWIIDHATEFNADTIRQYGHVYSYEAVGKHLYKIYQQAVNKRE